MHIGIVGGVDRNQHRFPGVAKSLGHTLECHGGHLVGTGLGSLENLVLRSQVVVIVTDVNSHGAVWIARDLARRHARPLVFVRKLGVAKLRELLCAQ